MIWKNTCAPMFAEALLTIVKIWKQPKCLLTEEWIKICYIYKMEYDSAIKIKNAICSNMDLKIASRLPSVGSHRVRHDWSDLVAAAAAVISQSVYFFRVNVHSPFTPLVEIILIFQGPVWVSDPLWSLPQFSRFNCSFYYTFLLPTLLLNSSSLLPLR